MSNRRKVPETHDWHGDRLSVEFSIVNGRMHVEWFPKKRKLRDYEMKGFTRVRDRFLLEIWRLAHHVDTEKTHARFSERFPLLERDRVKAK